MPQVKPAAVASAMRRTAKSAGYVVSRSSMMGLNGSNLVARGLTRRDTRRHSLYFNYLWDSPTEWGAIC